jgi:hypothetical protein
MPISEIVNVHESMSTRLSVRGTVLDTVSAAAPGKIKNPRIINPKQNILFPPEQGNIVPFLCIVSHIHHQL